MAAADAAQTTGDHDWFVVPPFREGAHALFKCTKIAAQSRAPKFVVKRGCANRSLQHDVERRNNSFRLPKMSFPWLYVAGNFEVRRGEAAKPSLWFRPSPNRALIANLATRPRRGSGIWRDRSGMIMCFHFHHDMSWFFDNSINLVCRIREETRDDRPFNHRSIVRICRENPFPVSTAMGVADHLEQRLLLMRSVN